MDRARARRIATELRGGAVGGWIVGEYLGNGASAVVVTAQREGQTAALKLIDPEMEERYGAAQQLARIERECELVGHSEPHLVKIFGGGRCPDTGYLYLVMELLAYPALTALIPAMPRDQIGPVIRQVAGAARFLETRGLAHRDIKPDNIAITPDCQRVTLLDLGVVRPISDTSRADAGSGDAFLGTTRYSPPEYLLREEEDTELGWRAVTFYQLGAVLHDMIMRKRLFDEINGPPARLIEAVRHARPVIDAPDVVPHLISLARSCLQKDWRLRLVLVQWDNFAENPPRMHANDAKERIRRRLTVTAGGSVTPRAPAALPSRRKILEQAGGSIASAAREVCLQAGTFPPLEVTHHATTDKRRVTIRTGPSEQHSLEAPLSICLSVTLLDEEGLVVRVCGVAAVNGLPTEIPREAWMLVYVGELAAPPLRGRLDDFLHIALDAAQNAGVMSTGSLLSLPVLE